MYGSRMTGLGTLSAVLLGVVSVASPTLIASNDNMASTLRGINALNVVVEGLNPMQSGMGWRQINSRPMSSLHLRKAGITVSESALPYLYVQVTLVRVLRINLNMPTAAAFLWSNR